MDSYEIDDESEVSEYDDNDYSDVDYGAGAYMGEAHYGSPETAPIEIKEQMYQDKLADLKRQLQQLQERSLPEYIKRLRRLDTLYRERQRANEIIQDLEIEMVEQDFIHEKRSAVREFEEQKVFLREQLIAELEEKQKLIEAERHNMELTGDSMELKQISTRKLRRRANEPSNSGPGEKRRKPAQFSSLTYTLDESDILDDLKIINKNKAFAMSKTGNSNNIGSGASNSLSSYSRDIKVEDGKLFYEKRWFRRGQSVQVEQKNGDKFPAMISAIGSDAIWVRKSTDNSKVRIYITQLAKGKFLLKRRTS